MVETDHGAYYYHPDHLGSSSVVTDKDGKFYESLEYFPFGETWIHNKVSSEQQSTPYKYTSKEQDKETGWYYFGERYYFAQLSRWIAADPPLAKGDYLPKADDLDTDHDYYWQYNNDETAKLPGMGGVYNPINLDAYQYAGQNPTKYIDPDGNLIITVQLKGEFSIFSGGAVYGGRLYEIYNGQITAYEGFGTNPSSGFRIDGGLDICGYSTDTKADWSKQRWGTVTGDYGLLGGGILFSDDGETGLNFSVGYGFGASFGKSGPELGPSDYNFTKKMNENEKAFMKSLLKGIRNTIKAINGRTINSNLQKKYNKMLGEIDSILNSGSLEPEPNFDYEKEFENGGD